MKLTQTSNRVRVNPTASNAAAYAENPPGGDSRFRYNVGSVQSIATSRGDDDSGLFALDLGDERYLPFEGSGACGTFVLEFPPTLRPFDYGTISDVVLNFRYTALDGGGPFRTVVANGLRERINVLALKTGRVGLFHAFDLRRDRPDVWSRLKATGSAALTISTDDLPYYTSSHTVSISDTRILAKVGSNASYAINVNSALVTLTAAVAGADLPGLVASSIAPMTFGAPTTIATTTPGQLQEMIVVINYSMDP